jgi:hypothetical protein
MFVVVGVHARVQRGGTQETSGPGGRANADRVLTTTDLKSEVSRGYHPVLHNPRRQ